MTLNDHFDVNASWYTNYIKRTEKGRFNGVRSPPKIKVQGVLEFCRTGNYLILQTFGSAHDL